MRHGRHAVMVNSYAKENYVSQMPMNWWRGHLIGRLARHVAKYSFGEVLDAGCGHGAVSIMLAELGVPVTAVDINKNALAHAKKMAMTDQFCGDEILFINASLLDLPFPAAQFQTVCAFEVLEHIWPDDLHAVLCELRRVTIAPGCIIATVPVDRGEYMDAHVNFFTQESIVPAFTEAGWENTQCALAPMPDGYGDGKQILVVAEVNE